MFSFRSLGNSKSTTLKESVHDYKKRAVAIHEEAFLSNWKHQVYLCSKTVYHFGNATSNKHL